MALQQSQESGQNRPQSFDPSAAREKLTQKDSFLETVRTVGIPAALALATLWIQSKMQEEEKERKEAAPQPVSAPGAAAPVVATELAGGVEPAKKEPQEQADTAKVPEYVEGDVEIQSAGDIGYLGDSIGLGLTLQYDKDERPGFLGESGFASHRTLSRMRLGKEILRGKRAEVKATVEKDAIAWMKRKYKKQLKREGGSFSEEGWKAYLDIHFAQGHEEYVSRIERQARSIKGKRELRLYTGGNNISYSSPESILGDMKEMIALARDFYGVEVVKVATRIPPRRDLPIHPSYKGRWTTEQFEERREKGLQLRALVMSTDFGPGVKVVDLYEALADSEGWLKEEYATGPDPLHPHAAYGRVISLMDAA